MKELNVLITKSGSDYELLDSGLEEKLERFGKFVLSRPDPQALWNKRLQESDWKKADAKFVREEGKSESNKSNSGWVIRNKEMERWDIELAGLKFNIKPTAFKHVGIFPEQFMNWKWLESQIEKSSQEQQNNDADSGFEVLNLFGYTGGASLICAKAGAKVVHVDGSKAAINWAKENAELSGLKDKPIRWILDDARSFVAREIKRERKYDGIIMDPPAFGHGPENEVWKIEEHFLTLVEDCKKILKDKPSFFLINGYSAGYSAIAYENILLSLVEKYGGSIDVGELTIQEKEIKNNTTRLLPCGIYARWSL